MNATGIARRLGLCRFSRLGRLLISTLRTVCRCLISKRPRHRGRRLLQFCVYGMVFTPCALVSTSNNETGELPLGGNSPVENESCSGTSLHISKEGQLSFDRRFLLAPDAFELPRPGTLLLFSLFFSQDHLYPPGPVREYRAGRHPFADALVVEGLGDYRCHLASALEVNEAYEIASTILHRFNGVANPPVFDDPALCWLPVPPRDGLFYIHELLCLWPRRSGLLRGCVPETRLLALR